MKIGVKDGMIIGKYEPVPGTYDHLQDGKFHARWHSGPRRGQVLAREEFEAVLRECNLLTCRVCGRKMSSGSMDISVLPDGEVFAEHADCVGKSGVSG